MKRASHVLSLCGVVASLSVGSGAQTAQVPPVFQDLYAELSTRLDDFDRRVSAQWTGLPAPVLFSAEFFPANSNRERDLLESLYPGFTLTLDRFQALGLEAVTFNISYPLLSSRYHASADERREYISLYRRLALDVRARGMKLIVKSQAMLPAPYLRVGDFYAGIRTYDEYRRGRIEVVRTIASDIRPDFLSVQTEPDTEAFVTGQPVGTPEGSLDLVNALVYAVRLANSSVTVGAGIGTWQPGYGTYVGNLLTRSSVDYIDLHVYPINWTFLDRVLGISDLAAIRGKAVAVSDAWLYKIRDAEVPYAPFLFDAISRRDPYDFWAPLDERFLRVMVKLAHARRFAFLSPFWSHYFFVYLDYDRARYLDDWELDARVNAAAVMAMRSGTTTTTGTAYRRMIRW